MNAGTNGQKGGKSNGKLVLALPSKGRLLEQCNAALARVGLTVTRPAGAARGYKAGIDELPGVEVSFVSAAEIAQLLKTGAVHLGVTGEDLIREAMIDADGGSRSYRPGVRPCRRGGGGAGMLARRRRMADLEQMASPSAACTVGACASPASTWG